MAAYELLTLGFANVSVLDGGMGEWKKSGRCAFSLLTATQLLHV